MEDRTGGNPDKLPLILLLVVGSPVTCVVVVLFLNSHRIINLLGIGMPTFWNRDYALFTREDEVPKVSPVYTIEPVF